MNCFRQLQCSLIFALLDELPMWRLPSTGFRANTSSSVVSRNSQNVWLENAIHELPLPCLMIWVKKQRQKQRQSVGSGPWFTPTLLLINLLVTLLEKYVLPVRWDSSTDKLGIWFLSVEWKCTSSVGMCEAPGTWRVTGCTAGTACECWAPSLMSFSWPGVKLTRWVLWRAHSFLAEFCILGKFSPKSCSEICHFNLV